MALQKNYPHAHQIYVEGKVSQEQIPQTITGQLKAFHSGIYDALRQTANDHRICNYNYAINNRQVFNLLTCKMHNNRTLPWGKKYVANFHYYSVSGELMKDKLESIANFAVEIPQKVKSWLEILENPGDLPVDGKPLSTDDFEIIFDEDHDGHGYIPRTYLDQFLGKGTPASQTRDIQVRLCGPKICLFKGNLVKKQGIQKIQLRKNMCKVSPSLTCSDEWVSRVITQ
jgi:hypothetical protein